MQQSYWRFWFIFITQLLQLFSYTTDCMNSNFTLSVCVCTNCGERRPSLADLLRNRHTLLYNVSTTFKIYAHIRIWEQQQLIISKSVGQNFQSNLVRNSLFFYVWWSWRRGLVFRDWPHSVHIFLPCLSFLSYQTKLRECDETVWLRGVIIPSRCNYLFVSLLEITFFCSLTTCFGLTGHPQVCTR
jgi:hypothetical protein